jgi:hypothetical protein
MYPPYFFTPVSSSVQPQKEGSGVSPHTSGASTPLSSSPSPQQQQQNSPSSGLKTQSPYSSVNFSTVGSNVNESLYIPSSATTDLLGISYSAYVSDTTSSLMGAKEEGFNFNHLQFKNRIKSLEKLKV